MKTNMQFIMLGLLLSIIVLNANQSTATAQESNGTPSQIVDPFIEMKPGIYVAWEWWNDTGNFEYDNTDDPYENEPYYYEVYDIYGNLYIIEDNFTYSYVDNWNFTNLLVIIILDPDASVMAALAEHQDDIDLWGLFWMPDTQSFTGDEVFLYSLFYFSSWYSYMYYSSDFIWYTENMTEVNPDDIIPYLAEGYEWASYMNGSIEFEYEWNYGGYGYDVNEMFLDNNQSLWMEHYFLGLTAFNDTNNNGIMDVSYTEVPIDNGESGWTYFELNNSEQVYDFIPINGTIGEVETPHLNEEGEIQWSAEITNIDGELWSSFPAFYIDDINEFGYDLEHEEEMFLNLSEPIPARLDSFSMTYKFDAIDDAAILKIDQYIGEFSDPETGGPIDEIQGLGLALNYWSSFSSSSITAWVYEENLEPEEPPEEPPDDSGEVPEVPTNLTTVEDVPEGVLQFLDEDTLRTIVDFGGTYIWGKDGNTYNVGTTVMPSLLYLETTDEMTPAGTMDKLESYSWQMYYYSSCYTNWSGYSITHDPIFSVFPERSPSQVSQFIDTVLITSLGIGGVGVLALVLVGIRTVSLRRSP